MANLYKRNGIYWFRRDPVTGRRASSGCRDKKAAELEYRKRERIASDPAYAAAEAATLAEWAARMVAAKKRTRSAKTAKYYAQKIGHALRIWGEAAPLSEITPRTVVLYLDQRRREGAAELTLDKELTAIRQVVKMARHAGCYSGDPAALRPPDFSADYRPRTRHLTVPEAVALLRVLAPRRAAHVAFFLATGARLGEAERARPGDIDWSAGTVLLRGTKTRAALRRVPTLRHTRDLLAAAEPWLPFDRWGNIQRDLAVACKHAGIEPATANDLRRTTATWLVEAGVSFDLIAKVLGHTSSQMLHRVYGQPRTSKIGDLIDAEFQAGTKTSQSAFEGVDGDPENRLKSREKAPVAQRIEQRFPKPSQWADVIGEVHDLPGETGNFCPVGTTGFGTARYKNVTMARPVTAAARKALARLAAADPPSVSLGRYRARQSRGSRAGTNLLAATVIAQSADPQAEAEVIALLAETAELLTGDG